MRTFTDEIDYSDETTIGPMPVAPVDEDVTQESPPVSTFAAPVMNDTARALTESESSVLKAHGIGSSELLFDAGMALADVGHTALDNYAAEYEALPTAATAIADLKATVAKEGREDVIRDLARYRVDIDGKLSKTIDTLAGRGASLEPTAWRQLAQVAGSQNINAGLAKRTTAERRLRTRGPADDRSVYAIVSSDTRRGYAVCDVGEVADHVARGLSDARMGDSKCEITYDAESTRYKIRAILQAPVDIMAHRGVGRVHRVFMDITGGDNGETSIGGVMGVLRIRCLNATLSQADAMRWSRIHRGDASEIRRMVSGTVAKWSEVANEMRQLWADAAGQYYLDAKGARLSPMEAIARLVAHKYLPAGGLSQEDAIDAYTQAWQAEEGVYSAAGVIMAAQRAAHETTWKTKRTTDEVEAAASDLLYQHNYVLPEVTS